MAFGLVNSDHKEAMQRSWNQRGKGNGTDLEACLTPDLSTSWHDASYPVHGYPPHASVGGMRVRNRQTAPQSGAADFHDFR